MITKKTFLITLIALMSFLFIACSPEQAVPSEPSTTDTLVEEVQEPSVVEKEDIITTNLDEETISLINKAKGYNNYEYTYDLSSRNQYGSYIQEKSYKVLYKNGQIKKVYSEAVKLGEVFQYNEVYLSENEPKALVSCTLSSLSCEGYHNKGYRINVGTELPEISPLEIVKNIPLSAKNKGSNEVIDNRKTVIINYQTDNGNYENVYLDSYYGLPLKRETYTYDNDEIIILKTERFFRLSVNNVKSSDLTFPESYNIIN